MKATLREKRIIRIGAATAAILLALYALSYLPSREGLSNSVETQKKMLRKELDILNQKDSVKARLSQYNKRIEQELARLLPGDNPNLASAELQKTLKELADQSGVTITSKSNLPEKKPQDKLVKISVRIETNCIPEQLVLFLTAIQNYPKFLSVDELLVSSYRIQKKFEIRPSLMVSGYIAAREANEKPKTGL